VLLHRLLVARGCLPRQGLEFARRVARARSVGATVRLVLQALQSPVQGLAVELALVGRLQLAKAKHALALPQASHSLVRAPAVQRGLVCLAALATAQQPQELLLPERLHAPGCLAGRAKMPAAWLRPQPWASRHQPVLDCQLRARRRELAAERSLDSQS
jgi:hypothetical protein